MPRNTNIDQILTTGTTRMAVAYGGQSKIAEVVMGIKDLRSSGEEISSNPSLRIAVEEILATQGKTVKDFDNWEEVGKFLATLGQDITIEELLGANQVVKDDFRETVALNSAQMEELLKIYDENRGKKAEEIETIAKKNPLFRNVSVREIIVRKVELENKLVTQGIKTEDADKFSDKIVETELRLQEEGITKGASEVLAEKIVNKSIELKTITKEEVVETIGQSTTVEEVLRVAKVASYELEISRQTTSYVEELMEKIGLNTSTTNDKVKEEVRTILVDKAVAWVSEQPTIEEVKETANQVTARLRPTDNSPTLVAVEQLAIKAREFRVVNEKSVAIVNQQKEFDAMWSDVVLENPNMTQAQAEAARDFVKSVAKLPMAGFEESKNEAIEATTGTIDDNGQTITRSMAENKWIDLKQTFRLIRSGKEGLEDLGKLKDKAEKLGVKIPVNNNLLRPVDSLLNLVKKDPGLARVLVQVSSKLDAFNNFYNGLGYKVFAKVGGERAVTWLATKIGGEAGKTLAVEGLKIFASKGLQEGAKVVVGQLAAKVGIQVSAKLAGLAVGLTNPVGWAITAGLLLIDVAKNLKKQLKKITDKIEEIIPSIKGDLEKYLGGFGGKVAGFGMGAMGVLIGIPALIGTLAVTSIVTPVIMTLFIGIIGYNLIFVQPQIGAIKPPEGMGGGECVLKSKTTENDGKINCNQNAPETDYPGINKARFVGVANRWTGGRGKNYSEECYDDVVNRAVCAGINPAYALWIWAHESGASNYDVSPDDFGMSALGNQNDFNDQITKFLATDPASACLGKPKIGNDYWLAWATNFFNGYQVSGYAPCDPDAPNPDSAVDPALGRKPTPRDYVGYFKSQWSWISNEPLPSSIKISSGGSNCGDNGATNSYEFTDSQGNEWLCYENDDSTLSEIPNFPEWDPNTPLPEGCPYGLPSSGRFTQGPFAPSCSHQSMSAPAIDIGAAMGTAIIATHNGVVSQGYDNIYGYYVDLHGTCEGKEFLTRYAHMPAGGFTTENGATVKRGDRIGTVDNTGSSTGSHLHFHIVGLDKDRFGQYLGLSAETTEKLWGCCGDGGNTKYCP